MEQDYICHEFFVSVVSGIVGVFDSDILHSYINVCKSYNATWSNVSKVANTPTIFDISACLLLTILTRRCSDPVGTFNPNNSSLLLI